MNSQWTWKGVSEKGAHSNAAPEKTRDYGKDEKEH